MWEKLNKNQTDFLGPYSLLAKRLDSMFSFFLNRPYHSIQENLRHTIRLTRHKRSASIPAACVAAACVCQANLWATKDAERRNLCRAC